MLFSILGLEMDGDGHKDLQLSNENRKMQPRLLAKACFRADHEN